MKYVPYEKMSIQDFEALIDETLDRWNDLYKNGGSDPFWPDGVKLNLVRNHIIYYQGLIRAKKAEPEQLTLFSVLESDCTSPKLPPEVPASYMADPEGIRAAAKKTFDELAKYDDHSGEFSQVIHSLSVAIARDNLVEMRRYRNTAYWVERISA